MSLHNGWDNATNCYWTLCLVDGKWLLGADRRVGETKYVHNEVISPLLATAFLELLEIRKQLWVELSLLKAERRGNLPIFAYDSEFSVPLRKWVTV